MKIHYGKVHLPHIDFTVHLRRFKPRPGHKSLAWIRHDKRGMCTIYLRADASVFTVVHELTHAMQYICQDTGMIFDNEMEHGAFIMEFLMCKVYGKRHIQPK